MKILYAFNQDLNPYVSVLIHSLEQAGCPVDTGTDKFWDADLFDYDIVHIQWPETLLGWRAPSSVELIFLKRRLKEIQQRATIVFTRHNDVSHHSNEQNAEAFQELYALCESECDVMIHLGEASREACRNRPDLRNKQHVMIPIPVYDELYAPWAGMNSQEAKQKLGLPLDKQAVLAFGNFRFEKEKDLVLHAFQTLRDPSVHLVAPKWYKPREIAYTVRHPMLTVRSARKSLWATINRMRLGSKKIMTDEEVALYFAAADVIFLQRIEELNSGNLPMAYLFGKVVLGPDCGNIGYWCRETENPVFNPEDPSSVVQALRDALRLSSTSRGEENHQFAMTRWSTKRAGEAYASLYRSLHA